MKAITLRNIPPDLAEAVKREKRRRGTLPLRSHEALQRQDERLSAQVTDLTRYSGRYGAGPGGAWR